MTMSKLATSIMLALMLCLTQTTATMAQSTDDRRLVTGSLAPQDRHAPRDRERGAPTRNGLIEIVLDVCNVHDPARCKDVHLTYVAENVTPFQCLYYGQPEIAKWVENNPNWVVTRWKCGQARAATKT
jgi:hypothetical protein